MIYILLLILLAIIGGPWLVAFALTLTGVWFVVVWTMVAIVGLVMLGVVVLVVVSTFAGQMKFKRRLRLRENALSELAELELVEPGIYKGEDRYFVEVPAGAKSFPTLDEARVVRDVYAPQSTST